MYKTVWFTKINNPTKQFFIKRYFEDKNGLSNIYTLKNFSTSIFLLVDNAKIPQKIKILKDGNQLTMLSLS
jgi:hypothetical protein